MKYDGNIHVFREPSFLLSARSTLVPNIRTELMEI